jgi:hypothetical protein
MTQIPALAFTFAMFVAPVPARAGDPPMPVYDVATFCSGHHPNYATEKGCVIDQYYSRRNVSEKWVDASPAVRAECIANSRWNDYAVLEMCLASHENDSKVMER